MNNYHDPHTGEFDPIDARVDALARAAGQDVRRPAPAVGLAGVQRARRNRQIAQSATGGAAVIALIAVGGFALADRRPVTNIDNVTVTSEPLERPASSVVEPNSSTDPTGELGAPLMSAAPGSLINGELSHFVEVELQRDANGAVFGTAASRGFDGVRLGEFQVVQRFTPFAEPPADGSAAVLGTRASDDGMFRVTKSTEGGDQIRWSIQRNDGVPFEAADCRISGEPAAAGGLLVVVPCLSVVDAVEVLDAKVFNADTGGQQRAFRVSAPDGTTFVRDSVRLSVDPNPTAPELPSVLVSYRAVDADGNERFYAQPFLAMTGSRTFAYDAIEVTGPAAWTIDELGVQEALPSPDVRPEQVYVTREGLLDTVILVDPVTGEATDSEPVDPDTSSSGAIPLGVNWRWASASGEVAYRWGLEGFGEHDSDYVTPTDRCGQVEVFVEGAASSTVPTFAHVIRISPDGRHLVTASTTCPEQGLLAPGDAPLNTGFEQRIEVYDADRPELPGRLLFTVPANRIEFGAIRFSPSGALISVEINEPGAEDLRVFNLAEGVERNLLDGCTHSGNRSNIFVDEQVMAISSTCGDSSVLRFVEEASGATFDVAVPVASGDVFFAEVERSLGGSFDDRWFTVCSSRLARCWIGHGTDPLVELDGAGAASFNRLPRPQIED